MNMHMINKHRQKGFSLIEALVAFLILSVGMLGIASLQTISLKSGQTASFRSVAVIKAQEIINKETRDIGSKERITRKDKKRLKTLAKAEKSHAGRFQKLLDDIS